VPERIVPFNKVQWADFISNEEAPLAFCLRKDVPVYIKVRRNLYHVYYRFRRPSRRLGAYKFHLSDKSIRISTKWEAVHIPTDLPLAGFNDDLLYLRLDRSSLVELASDPFTSVSSFSRDGFSVPPVGHANAVLEDATLSKVEFHSAFLVEKKKWKSANAVYRPPTVAKPESYEVALDINENDLYFSAGDIEALKREARQLDAPVSYKFSNRARPGINRMFEAAYALNASKLLSTDDLDDWLKKPKSENPFRHKSIRTARKFVPLTLDRSKGRKRGSGREDFDLNELDDWTIKDEYQYFYVSKGLSYVLAIAEWWQKTVDKGRDHSIFDLAQMLAEKKFYGLEIGDLVYLISGSRISEKDASHFELFLKRMGFEEDKIVDRNSTPSQLEKAKFSEEFKRFAERHCLLLPDD